MAVALQNLQVLVLVAWVVAEQGRQEPLIMEQMELLTQAVAVVETLYNLADLMKADLLLVAAALAS